MLANLKTGVGKRIRVGVLALAVSAAVAIGSAGTAEAASVAPSASITVNTSANLAAAHHAASLVAAAQRAAANRSASPASVTQAMNAAQAAWARTALVSATAAAPTPGLMQPFTNNANGHSCHWYGYCDFRLSNNRARELSDLLNVGAGSAALCAVIAPGAGTIACGVISAILWGESGWISYLVDRWHRGIFIRVFYTGGGYIWHQ